MEFIPNEQIKAHKRTDRTITTSASKSLLPPYGSVGGIVLVAAPGGEAAARGVW